MSDDKVTFLDNRLGGSVGDLRSEDGARDYQGGGKQYFSDQQMKLFEGIFHRLDINGDGQVSPSELRKALKFMNIRVDMEVCVRMVNDFSDDGFLNIEIFMGIVTDLFRKGELDPIAYNIKLAKDEKKKTVINSVDDLLKIFRSFDQDNSGHIETSEIRALAQEMKLAMSETEINKFMERADKNNDGKIDQEEFLEYFGGFLF